MTWAEPHKTLRIDPGPGVGQHGLGALRRDLLLDLSPVIQVITQGVMHRRRTEVRIRAEDILHLISRPVQLSNDPHRQAGPAHVRDRTYPHDMRVFGQDFVWPGGRGHESILRGNSSLSTSCPNSRHGTNKLGRV